MVRFLSYQPKLNMYVEFNLKSKNYRVQCEECINIFSSLIIYLLYHKLLFFFLVGGKESVRRYWPKFFQDTDILVFVVDASNNSNQSVVVSEIKSLLGDARLASVPILVLANKQVMLILISKNTVSNDKLPYF